LGRRNGDELELPTNFGMWPLKGLDFLNVEAGKHGSKGLES
jgi:hypothetical protein